MQAHNHATMTGDRRPAPAGWGFTPGSDMPFLTRYGMDEAERRRRKAFLGITEADAENVRRLRDAFARRASDFAERFYEHLLADPHTRAFLRDPDLLKRLKGLQAEYFTQLLDGVFDAPYYEGRLRVGVAHQRIGLSPVWYLGAYNQYIQLTFPLFVRAFGGDLEKVLPLLLSLVKVIFLDIGLALDTYFQEATAQLRQRNEELQQALGLYWQAQQREERLHKMANHEVRGSLAAVITGLEDLQDSAGPNMAPADAEQLANLTRRCWKLSELLGEMLAASPTGQGAALVDARPIFEALQARFGLYAEGRDVKLVMPEKAPRVWADAVQLREAFANLIANAVNYLDKEPGRVDVTCRDNGEFCEFCVTDNGPGVPEAIRERVFEPFVRGPAQAGRRPGTGLGLYFVRTVVEQGGGRVWVESTPGEGSRFYFTVPRKPPGAKEGGSHEHTTGAPLGGGDKHAAAGG
jgi:signal transduction histidine kinase